MPTPNSFGAKSARALGFGPERTVSAPTGFYRPTIKANFNATGTVTVGLSTFSLTGSSDGWVQGSLPGATTWCCEFEPSADIPVSTAFMGAATQAWWTANPSWVGTTSAAGWWYLGSSSSNGSGSGTTFAYTGRQSAGLAAGDVFGLVYNNATNKLNIYKNGVLIVTVTFPATAQTYPVMGYWTGNITGAWRSTTSTYFGNYALP